MTIESLEKKVIAVEENPTKRKVFNLINVRYDIEDIECAVVDEQMEHKYGTDKYNKCEKIIDLCNALYERIENLEYQMEESA